MTNTRVIVALSFATVLLTTRINALEFQSATLEKLDQTAAIGTDAGRVGNSFDGSRPQGQSTTGPTSTYAGMASLVGPTQLLQKPAQPSLAAPETPAEPPAQPNPPAPAGDSFFGYLGKAIVAPVAGTVRGAIAGAKGGAETGKKIAGTPGAVAMGIMVGLLGLVVGAVAGVVRCAVGTCKAFQQLFKGNI